MAFPMMPARPLPDLIKELVDDHDVEDVDVPNVGRCLIRKRKDGGPIYRVFIGDLATNAKLMPSKVENIVRRLGLDAHKFGFLDGPDPSGDDD